MADQTSEEKRLRDYLNQSIQGKNTNSIISAMATGSEFLINNSEAVNDSLYAITAQGKYLDQRMANNNITRPDSVGLSDDVFRELGIEISNRKQVRDLIMNILRIAYGEEFTRATMASSEFEPYQLSDGDTLIISYDDQESVEVTFSTSQFASIAAATAQETADAITKVIRQLGKKGSAIAKDDGLGGYVEIISDTDGPSSSVKVLGGKAQNVLKFPQIRSTSGDFSTQWTLGLIAGGYIRATWTGGANPSIGKVRKGDYVNIYGSSFSDSNKGTFTITNVKGGLISNAYIEFTNPNGVAETVTQGTADAVLFYNPVRYTLNNKVNFAAAYQTEPRVLEILMPATTRVIRRDRIGAAYLHDSVPAVGDNYGPFIFDDTKAYGIGAEEANTTEEVDSSTNRIVTVDDASSIPDATGFLVFGFGTDKEEGPIPYIARPSSTSLLIDPSYKFKYVHPTGTNVSLVAKNYVYEPAQNGSDYQFFVTDTVSGRVYTEDTINLVAASGINVVIIILYPSDIGLGKYGTGNSEKYIVWGPDEV